MSKTNENKPSKTAFVGLLAVVAVISALVTALAMPSPSTTATAAATPICSQTRETTFADGSPFFDYTHKETGAKILKAQHPEFELWSQGIYARQGQVAAIDWRKNGGK